MCNSFAETGIERALRPCRSMSVPFWRATEAVHTVKLRLPSAVRKAVAVAAQRNSRSERLSSVHDRMQVVRLDTVRVAAPCAPAARGAERRAAELGLRRARAARGLAVAAAVGAGG